MKYLNEEYRDRGKMKWAGFYLSEHSSEQEKLKATRESVNEPKEKMSLPKIGEVLKQARIKNRAVAIQREAVDSEGRYYDDVIGFVLGADELGLYIGDEKVDYDEIRNVEIADHRKWSYLS